MRIFSFHLAKTSLDTTMSALFEPPTATSARGLRQIECMTTMTLGSPILSTARLQLGTLAVFGAWESEGALEAFLTETELGSALSAGWHVRLGFLRRWGKVSGFDDLPASLGEVEASAPVVAVTLARMKFLQIPRFIRWGRPVEELVRDHPGTTLALAAMRLPNTVSTFSVWRSQREMLDMVRGHGAVPDAERHAKAMVERKRKDFHYEFTTLRFRALSEHGYWEGRSNIVPNAIPIP
jgi:hypothetical protein